MTVRPTIFREHAALSAFENEAPRRRIFDIGALSDLSDEDYDALPPTVLAAAARRRRLAEDKRLFGDGKGFATPDGRARFVPTPYRPPAAATDEQWPFILNTGRVRDQWHTMTRTGRVPRLMAHQREPALDIHPADAARLDLKDGESGARRKPAWRDRVAGPPVGDPAQGRSLRADALDRSVHLGRADRRDRRRRDRSDIGPAGAEGDAGSASRAVAAQWSGLLLRGSENVPPGPYYWARAPLERGHAFTLTGWEPLPSDRGTELWITALLDAPPAAELVIYADPARGTFRYASIVGRRLDACLFIAATQAALPSRDALAALLGSRIEPDARAYVLAGGAGPGGERGGPDHMCLFRRRSSDPA